MKVLDSLPLLPASGAAACGDPSIFMGLLAVNCRLLAGLSPSECAVTSKHRVLPGFGRNCPPATPLECAVTQIDAVTPLECAVTKKWGEGVHPSGFSNFAFRISNFARARGVPDSTLVSRILVPAACGRGKR